MSYKQRKFNKAHIEKLEANLGAANLGAANPGAANPGAANLRAANPQLITDDTCDGTGYLMSSLGSTNVVILKRPQITAEIDSSHVLVLQEVTVNAGANFNAAMQSQKPEETPLAFHIPLEKDESYIPSKDKANILGATCLVVCSLLKENMPNPHALLEESTLSVYDLLKERIQSMYLNVRVPPKEIRHSFYVQPKVGTPSESYIPPKDEANILGGTGLVVHRLLKESTPNSYVQPKGGTKSNLIVSFKKATLTNFCFLLKGTKSYRDVLSQREIRHGLYFQPKGGTVSFSIADSRFDSTRLIFAFFSALHTSIFTCSATFRLTFFLQSQILCSALPAARFSRPNWAY
ncbi:hypothetical protein MMC22_003431 [Lobaria immixta]|nr:hypothetical protein [Lobaria immixta]